MQEEININLTLRGEASFFIQLLLSQTDMDSNELFMKMISLYKQVYFSDKELAWIKGSEIIEKLDSSSIKRKG